MCWVLKKELVLAMNNFAPYSDEEVSNYVEQNRDAWNKLGYPDSYINNYFGVQEPSVFAANGKFARVLHHVANALTPTKEGIENAKQTASNIGEDVIGGIETGLNAVTSLTAAPAALIGSGLGGLAYKAMTGGDYSLEEVSDLAKAYSKLVTYEPQTEMGQRGAENFQAPFNALSEVATKAGQKSTDIATKAGLGTDTASAVGATVESTLNVLPWVVGAKAGDIGFAAAKALRGEAVTKLTDPAPTNRDIHNVATVIAAGKRPTAPVTEDFTEPATRQHEEGTSLASPVPRVFGAKPAPIPVVGGATVKVGAPSNDDVLAVEKSLKAIYSETGIGPFSVAEAAKVDSNVRADLLDPNKDIPDAFQPLIPEKPNEAAEPPIPQIDLSTSEQKIADEVSQQAVDAGYTPEQAHQYGQLYAARYAARGERLGIDPYEAYKGGPEQTVKEVVEENKSLASSFADRPQEMIRSSGHAWLEELVADAAREGVDPQLKTDLQTVRDYLGNKGEEFTTEQHEKFARTAEAYFMEGKAPTSKLRAVFDNFKAWLTHIYQSVLDLNVPINNEIRGAFDRMLGTDKELSAPAEIGPEAKQALIDMRKRNSVLESLLDCLAA
jgi:hypothetical protein